MIISTKGEGTIQGLKLTQDGDSLTHQKFVDDIVLQGIPMVKEAKAFKQIMQYFSLVAGTEVSLTKSNVFFFQYSYCHLEKPLQNSRLSERPSSLQISGNTSHWQTSEKGSLGATD